MAKKTPEKFYEYLLRTMTLPEMVVSGMMAVALALFTYFGVCKLYSLL